MLFMRYFFITIVEARLNLLADYVEMKCIKNSFVGFLVGSIGGVAKIVFALIGGILVPIGDKIISDNWKDSSHEPKQRLSSTKGHEEMEMNTGHSDSQL